MIYFGTPSNPDIRAAMCDPDIPIGLFNSEDAGAVIGNVTIWAADNGAFGKGWKSDDVFRNWLVKHSDEDKAKCAFVVAPDVVGDADATLERSAPWLPEIRRLGYKVAFVAQNGQENLPVPWDAFDCLFIGGDTKWKLGYEAYDLAKTAKGMGKWVHMGRVNSKKRLFYAKTIGCDSADGTAFAFNPSFNFEQMVRWLKEVNDVELFTKSHKICPTCSQRKEINEFNKHRRTADGYYFQCRACFNLRQSQYRQGRGAVL